MTVQTDREALKAEIERKHFARAARLAETLGLHEEEVRELRLKALWQISAVYRNAPGTRILAEQYGVTKKELKSILEQRAEMERKDGNDRSLKPCYDQDISRYLYFEEWMERFFKIWDKLSAS